VQLLRLVSPHLDSRHQVATARTERLDWQAATVTLAPDSRTRWQVSQEELATSQSEQAGVGAEREQLTPVAPFAATLRDLDPDL
jgi:hypothetical protein